MEPDLSEDVRWDRGASLAPGRMVHPLDLRRARRSGWRSAIGARLAPDQWLKFRGRVEGGVVGEGSVPAGGVDRTVGRVC